MTPDLLNFLYELSQNNNRDWFDKNKPRYEKTVKVPFETFVGDLILRMKGSFEPDFNALPKQCIFRIYRDTRFSKDKTPYKTHISAAFTGKGGKASELVERPGYYFQLGFGKLMLGGGAYSIEKPQLTNIRKAIMASPSAWQELNEDPEFRKYFPEGIVGERNKILPPEFKAAAEQESMLYLKQFYFMKEMDPEITLEPDFLDTVLAHYQSASKINHFLRQAIAAE